MNEAEKLKSTLSSVFRRKGANGLHTRIFDDLDPAQQHSLLEKVRLNLDELAVIGSAESNKTWFLLTTQRIVWHLKGRDETLSVHDIYHVKADFPKMVATGTDKGELRELQIETVNHSNLPVEVEAGAPLAGVWNALLNLAARNHQKK